MAKVYWIPAVSRLLRAKYTPDVYDFFYGWWMAEGGNSGPKRDIYPSARYNWLCTKRKALGSTNFNKSGVQNYPLWVTGVAATASSIKEPYYKNLVNALEKGTPFSSPRYSGVRESLSFWAYGKECREGLAYADRVLELGRGLIAG